MRILWIIAGGLVFSAIVMLVNALQRQSVNSAPPPPAPDPLLQTDTTPEPITSRTYVIQDGDTLSSIAARRWGNARLWRRIVDANPGLQESAVNIGDEISLPGLDEFKQASDLVAELDASMEERLEADESDGEKEVIEIDGEGLDLGRDEEIKFAEVVPGLLIEDEDGSIVADEEFRIRGKGTSDEPYRVSWDLLASAADDYRPTLNKRGIPQRVAALNGKWVEIDGFVAFPLPQDTTEMIMMLNQWDGCCIGIPPTPYDAVEVKLTAPVAPGQRHAIRYGTVKGRLTVEPYLIENWLVGLYLMDDATLRLEL